LPLPEARTGVADYTNELDPEDEVEEYGLLHVKDTVEFFARFRKIRRFLRDRGWVYDRQGGSHEQYTHAELAYGSCHQKHASRCLKTGRRPAFVSKHASGHTPQRLVGVVHAAGALGGAARVARALREPMAQGLVGDEHDGARRVPQQTHHYVGGR
jgi:predicted RNA binding protein YcfA (HicA-like mRNA interferase family)